MTTTTPHTFTVNDLRAFTTAALAACAVPTKDAQITAHSLVEADQRGIGSHGLLRLPLYVKALQQGGINPTPNLAFEDNGGPTTTLNGDAGLGQVVMQAAVNWSLQRAGEFGVSVVAVYNSSHYGTGQYWTDQLTARGMIGILTSSTGPVTAPFGGVRTVLGTNPLTIAMPTGADPLTVDMATSAGALGKVLAARQAGTHIPEGWAVDAQGQPTTDPNEAIKGALMPFGGPKGSGLSVLLEGLAAGLTPATFAFNTQDVWDHPDMTMNNGHLLITLDTGAFTGREAVAAKIATLVAEVRGSGDGAVAPGDIEYGRNRENAEHLTLGDSLVSALNALAGELKLEFPAAQTGSSV